MEIVFVISGVLILILIMNINMLFYGKGYKKGFGDAENLYDRILRRKEVNKEESDQQTYSPLMYDEGIELAKRELSRIY